MRSHRLRSALLPASLALALVAAACGGDSDDTGVATLQTDAGETEEAASDAEQTDEEALLAYSACMRDEGVEDFPDPVVQSDGGVDFGFGPGGDRGEPSFDPRSEEFRAARDACDGLLGEATLGGGRLRRGDQTELTDAFLAYSECLRNEGLDVGDFVPGQGDGPGAGAESGGGPPEGGGPGEGGRSGRIAEQLGLDPDDPEVQDAMETCEPVLEDAFGGLGPNADAEPGEA